MNNTPNINQAQEEINETARSVVEKAKQESGEIIADIAKDVFAGGRVKDNSFFEEESSREIPEHLFAHMLPLFLGEQVFYQHHGEMKEFTFDDYIFSVGGIDKDAFIVDSMGERILRVPALFDVKVMRPEIDPKTMGYRGTISHLVNNLDNANVLMEKTESIRLLNEISERLDTVDKGLMDINTVCWYKIFEHFGYIEDGKVKRNTNPFTKHANDEVDQAVDFDDLLA